jgi:hypothetical protein
VLDQEPASPAPTCSSATGSSRCGSAMVRARTVSSASCTPAAGSPRQAGDQQQAPTRATRSRLLGSAGHCCGRGGTGVSGELVAQLLGLGLQSGVSSRSPALPHFTFRDHG